MTCRAPHLALRVGLAVTAALLCLDTIAAAQMDDAVPSSITDRVTASVGKVSSAGRSGSGWIAADGTVVTNFHVARGGTGDIFMTFSDGETVECYTAGAERDMDLAALKCPTGERRPLPLRAPRAASATPVAVIGYPGGEGPVLTRGAITAERRTIYGVNALAFTALVRPGSSGSPVVDGSGAVRGVVTWSGGYGVPAANLEPLLAEARGLPATKSGAEWRLRIRRGLLVLPLAALLGFVIARRRGDARLWVTVLRWSTAGIVVAMLLTQVQFMTAGPTGYI